jgi:predicted nuclease with TOPRIM domain
MKKQNLLLYGVLAGILGLGSMGTFKAGSGHVETVKENNTLVKTNTSLKQENQKLTTENTQLKVTADSLTVEGNSLKEAVFTLENKVDNYETKIDEVSKTSRDNDNAFIREYKVSVPIPEVSDSTN